MFAQHYSLDEEVLAILMASKPRHYFYSPRVDASFIISLGEAADNPENKSSSTYYSLRRFCNRDSGHSGQLCVMDVGCEPTLFHSLAFRDSILEVVVGMRISPHDHSVLLTS